ncbi:MAG TPA: glycoside hydrolase family 28 protein [Candidatus Paceibacterota bacterium]|nr:glycoside hydrolase family 28 protein [Verrucomicrobiota bacterium]HOX04060.1 glycoside hydrolase family 28 protein [Verrucomicrobiota bacterium]HRZ46983.1 glycoside hydrolase family 28 protein [Candidatus Paceibacterota bacterium]HRZ93959.1 glycoside hydrolase family 28 protein [Candidatus Paceibacterota bacterium]
MNTSHRSDSRALTRRQWLGAAAGVGGASLASAGAANPEPAPANPPLDITSYGAVGDGRRLNTQAIQLAIDDCAEAGGGAVLFPAGVFRSGTLFLRSRVRLRLEPGAVLQGSPRLEDYPTTRPSIRSYTDTYTERSLLYAEDADGFAIEGAGTIDGQGGGFQGPYLVRPYLLRAIRCRGVQVRDVTFRDSPMWVQHYLACDDVAIRGIQVDSRCNQNNDGIDIDGCQRVTISDCRIDSGDDAIVLKSTLARPCRDVAIANCVLRSLCNALKLGTESNGGFANIAISNCAIYDTRLAGIAIEMVDGGLLEGVAASHLAMRNVRVPIFVRLGDRGRPFEAGMPRPSQGRLRHVSISHVQATGADRIGCSITGLPGCLAEDVSIDHVRIEFAGGGALEDARQAVPEAPEKYPEATMFGPLPAFGLYCRHVRGLHLSQIQLACLQPDARPAVMAEDVADLQVDGIKTAGQNARGPLLDFQAVRSAWVNGCWATPGGLLRVSGPDNRQIHPGNNIVPPDGKELILADGAREEDLEQE